jgi:hypothetical protein
MPKYMLLIYGAAEGGPSAEELPAEHEKWMDYTMSLREADPGLVGDQLHDVDTATTVRVIDGETQITDGPFAVTKELLAGYYIIDCPDLDAALGHAARAPIVTHGSVEVRPVVVYPAGAAPAPEEALSEA